MSLQTRISELVVAIASELNDTNSKRGELASLTTSAKTSVVAALNALDAYAKSLEPRIGDLSTLSTGAKTNLVVAINELSSSLSNATNINDATSSNTSTYSSDKINDLVTQTLADLIGAAPDALNTLAEIASELSETDSQIESLLISLSNRVRFDAAQTLTTPQAQQARSNINAISSADVGATDYDFVADFEAALV